MLMTTEAGRRFPCRIKLAVPAGGLGSRLTELHAWLDETCGATDWAMTPAGLRGVVNDAVAIYFLDATSAAAFVSRWCVGSRVEISGGFPGARGSAGSTRGGRAPQNVLRRSAIAAPDTTVPDPRPVCGGCAFAALI